MIIGGMQKLSLCDYPGTPAIVVFLQGCNFNCPFCHNRQLLSTTSGPEQLSPKEVLEYLQKRRKTVSAVVVSGGEPTIQSDLIPFIEDIKTLGYGVKLDTNGSKPEDVCSLLRHNLIDYIAMDIKAPWQKYDLLSGRKVEHMAIKESIKSIADSGIPHHFRTTHYPPMLSEDDLTEIKSFLPKYSTHIIQPYKNITQSPST
jgi:pyruvate formate lyase activating enzyme